MTDAFFSRLPTVKIAVVHANCADGLASAIFIRDAMPEVEIQFIQYNTDPHKALTPQPGIMFCDFSPFAETVEVEQPDGKKKRVLTELGKAQVQAWVDAGALILDHHGTVKDLGMIQPFLAAGQGVFGDEKTEPGVCGATLAYREIWCPTLKRTSRMAEGFAKLAGIRDTWQKHDPQWRNACIQAEMLKFFPDESWLQQKDFFGAGNDAWFSERWRVGEVVFTKHERAVQKTLEKAHRFSTAKGTRVVCFAGTHLSSDAAEALGEEADLVVGFTYEVENGTKKLICSNRTRGSFPVQKFAESYGGGGHLKAAGCNRVLTGGELNPYEHIQQLVEAFEAT